MDIATLLESHLRYMLAVAKEHVAANEFEDIANAIRIDHDRATTRTLLDIYRTEKTPAAAPVAVVPAPPKSRLIKPGSKAAKQRAEKAQRTRLENLARKRQEEVAADSGAQDAPATMGVA